MTRPVAAALSVVALVCAALAQTPPVRLSAAPSSIAIGSGAELRIHVTVTNTSAQDINFGTSPGNDQAELFFYITVQDADGRTAPETAYGRMLKVIPRTVTAITEYLAPGQSFSEDAVITKLFDITVPGRYTIKVGMAAKPGDPKPDVWADPIVVTVL